MADEKKKKLELLKQRNEANRIKLTAATNNSSAALNTNSSTTSVAGNSISSNVPSSISSIDQLIKETTKAPADINLEEFKKATRRISRYTNDAFTVSKMSQSILGIIIDTYEDGVQCDLGIPQYESDNEEVEERTPKETGTGYRRSVVNSKHRKTTFNTSSKKTQEGIIILEDKVAGRIPFDNKEEIGNIGSSNSKGKPTITEDMRRQILTSQELGDFLNYKTKYVERVS
jgi:hypothetical protein